MSDLQNYKVIDVCCVKLRSVSGNLLEQQQDANKQMRSCPDAPGMQMELTKCSFLASPSLLSSSACNKMAEGERTSWLLQLNQPILQMRSLRQGVGNNLSHLTEVSRGRESSPGPVQGLLALFFRTPALGGQGKIG